MDRLELDMEQPGLDESRQLRGVLVQEALELSEAAVEFGDRRRNEQGVAGPGAADPVLRAPEFAGALGPATTALEQPGVHLADEPERERQGLEPLQAMHHGVNVVRDLADVVDRLAGLGLGLEAQEVGQRRLRALNLGGEHRLLADVHVEEQLLARQEHGDAVKPAKGTLGEAQALAADRGRRSAAWAAGVAARRHGRPRQRRGSRCGGRGEGLQQQCGHA